MSRLWKFIRAIRTKFAKFIFRKHLGVGVEIDPNSIINGDVKIGDYTNINGPCMLQGSNPIRIGKFGAIGSGLIITAANHEQNYLNLQIKLHHRLNLKHSPNTTKGGVEIEDGVWIGHRVTILSGVTVGQGAVIGAGSVVTKDIPPYSVAVGVPAKVIKKRFSEANIKKLISLNWTDWSDDKMKRNRELFETDLTKKPIPKIK